jgi:hypothetical protein
MGFVMRANSNLAFRLILLVFVLIFASSISAQDDMASAEIENDDGGPVFVSGEVNVTFPFFGTFWPSPNVILRDATYYVTRDKDLYVPDQTTQVLGPVTSDPRISPFTYELQLPARPNGVLHDVDNNDDDDDGMMIFAVSLVNDFWGNPFVEERDGQLSLDAYSTVVIGVEQAVKDEILGGNLILYAPDDEQGFPSGFGPDGLLFTEDDDAAVRLPQGYTVVNLDSEPFLFDRSEEVALDLLEIELRPR